MAPIPSRDRAIAQCAEDEFRAAGRPMYCSHSAPIRPLSPTCSAI